MLHCIIIEDDELDREIAKSFLERIPFIKLIGSFSNALEAIGLIRSSSIQVLLMDIDLPAINGIEFIRLLPSPPLFIFITAHPEYALEGYDIHALDFIVKPLKFERLEQAIIRAKDYIEIKEKAILYDIGFENNQLLIKEGTSIIQLKINEILYLEALGDYTKIITYEKMYVTLHSLKNFIEKLPENRFLRIHRSFAVAIDKISKLKDNELILNDRKLPVGKTFRREVNKYLISG
jgi:DNA-binding LytR/AlgR family response regulator